MGNLRSFAICRGGYHPPANGNFNIQHIKKKTDTFCVGLFTNLAIPMHLMERERLTTLGNVGEDTILPLVGGSKPPALRPNYFVLTK